MANSRFSQVSFAKGELCPALHSRTDLDKYAIGLKTLKNGFVQQEGCVSNRPGLEFIGEAKYSSKETRLIPFTFNSEQTYVIEAGDRYFRFIQNGGYIHYPDDYETVALRGQIVEIETPYLDSEVQDLYYTQSADILTITHQNHTPMELIRYSHYEWELEEIIFQPSIEPPADVVAEWSGTTTKNARFYTYCVTAVDSLTDDESATSEFITQKGHKEAAWETSEYMTIAWLPVQGAREYNIYRDVNGVMGYIGTANEGDYVYPIYNGKYSGQTTVVNSQGVTVYRITLANEESTYVYSETAPAVDNMFYTDPELTDFYGKCSVKGTNTIKLMTRGGSFVDDNIEPDTSSTAPVVNNPFENDNNPACCTYFQQRKIYANTFDSPQTVYASKLATNNNFNYSRPLIASDSVEIALMDKEVNEIRHIISFKDLIALTSNSEYRINGTDGIFQANPAPAAVIQSTYGSSKVMPIISGEMVLFVQAGGTVLRDLGYEYLSDSYNGDELSIFASHLFNGKEVKYIAYAKEPFRLVYTLFTDGSLAVLSYNKKQALAGWGRFETDGKFLSVTTIKEGQEDVAYFIIERTVNGQKRKFVERNVTRFIDNNKKSFLVDAGLSAFFESGVTTIGGLNHLANKRVIALCDGGVVEGLVVNSSGQVTLPYKAKYVTIGLPYEFELETLGVEGDNTHGLKKIVNPVSIRVLNSREDFWICGNSGYERQLSRSIESINNPGYLFTGSKDETVLSNYDEIATVHIKQKHPLPITVSAISGIINIEDIQEA